MSDDVDAVFNSSPSDWDAALADIRAVLQEVANERSAVLDVDALVEASERGMHAVDALQREGDPRPALQELTSVAARLGEVLEAASPSVGGWYQLIDRLEGGIATLRQLY